MIFGIIEPTTVDTVTKAISGGGITQTDWTLFLTDNIIFYILGLIGTFLYFWFVIRSGNTPHHTFKEFFSDNKNKNTFYLHLVLYHSIILFWMLMGLQAVTMLFGDSFNFILSLVKLDLSTQLNKLYDTMDYLFPQGQLNAFTFLWGAGITFISRNVIPAIVNVIKDRFRKEKHD